MRNIKIKILRFIPILFVILSCGRDEVFYPIANSTIFSAFPNTNATGSNEPIQGMGYGSIFFQDGKIGSYPVLYLSNDDPIGGDNIVILLFDSHFYVDSLSKIRFEFYLHAVERTLKNLELFFTPIVKTVDIERFNYSQYKQDKSIFLEDRRLSYFFQLEKVEIPEKISKIPSCNGTFLQVCLSSWSDIFETGSFFGIAIEVRNSSSLEYQTTNENFIVTGSGIIEIASLEWRNWSGVVDESFDSGMYNWQDIKNCSFGSNKYIPKIIVGRN